MGLDNSSRRILHGMLVVAFLSAMLVSLEGTWASDEIPEEVRQSLQKNTNSLSSLSVTWERMRSTSLPPRKLMAKLKYPVPATEFLATALHHFKIQEGKYWTEFYSKHVPWGLDGKRKLSKPLKVESHEQAFNGVAFYLGTGLGTSRSHPQLFISPIEKYVKEPSSGRILLPEYFFSAGYKLPQFSSELGDHPQPESRINFLLRKGGVVTKSEESDLEGRSCMLVEIRGETRLHRFYLDKERGYVTLRWSELSLTGELAVQCDCRDFTRIEKTGIWLPKRCELAYHSYPTIPQTFFSKPLFRESFVVKKIEGVDLPPETFVLEYNVPGTYISDATLPGAKEKRTGVIEYRVPANPDDLDRAVEAARKGTKFEPTIPRSYRHLILIAANLLVVLLLVLVIWYRRRRAAAE